MARLGRAQPNTPVVVRNTLQDPPVLTTPAPIVVTHLGIRARPAWGQPNQGIAIRSTLADDPVLTTPAPIVSTVTVRRPVGPPIILRSSTEDTAVAASAPAPLVVSTATIKRPPGPPILVRSGTEDVPTSTPSPLVVVPAPRRTVLSQPIVLRGSLEDFATPAPYVITPRATRVVPGRPVILRSPQADVVLATDSIPPPLVIAAPARRVPGVALIVRAPLDPGACDCLTHRPFTGTTSRPGAGVTSRPCTC